MVRTRRSALFRQAKRGVSVRVDATRGARADKEGGQPCISDQKQEIRVHIRWMIRRDMPEVLQIEAESFEFPWVDEDFIRCLRQRNCIGMVAEHERPRRGLHDLRTAQDPHPRAELRRVPADYRRRGVGSQMVAKLIGKLSWQRRPRIVLEVRETNLPAQLFFRENGFRAVSVLHSYYDDTPEDAYLMQFRYRPQKPAAAAEVVRRLAG